MGLSKFLLEFDDDTDEDDDEDADENEEIFEDEPAM